MPSSHGCEGSAPPRIHAIIRVSHNDDDLHVVRCSRARFLSFLKMTQWSDRRSCAPMPCFQGFTWRAQGPDDVVVWWRAMQPAPANDRQLCRIGEMSRQLCGRRTRRSNHKYEVITVIQFWSSAGYIADIDEVLVYLPRYLGRYLHDGSESSRESVLYRVGDARSGTRSRKRGIWGNVEFPLLIALSLVTV